MEDMIDVEADICKIFSNPARLRIIKLLCENEMNAADLIKELNLSRANLSQHMSMLIDKGIAVSWKKGVNVHYALSGKNISRACEVMQDMAVDTIKRKHRVLDTLNS